MLITTPLDSNDIANPIDGLPPVNVLELNQIMRVDESLGGIRLASHIEMAMDTVNGQLDSFFNLTVYHQPAIALTDLQKRIYKRAVLHESCALVTDQYVDFDTASSGRMREEKQVQITNKSQRMRRIVNHCIADLTGKPRNRVKLI